MNTLFRKLDSLPIVKLLQLGALIIFAFGIMRIIPIWYQVFNAPQGLNASLILNGFLLTGINLSHSFFEPLILLGMAELIRKKQD